MLQKALLLIGLLIVLLLSVACAKQQTPSVKIDYSADFLDCVANEAEKGVFGDCTTDAVSDWLEVVVG